MTRPRPSEVVWAALRSGVDDATTLRDHLVGPPVTDPQTLAGVVARMRTGVSLMVGVREFLDDFALARADADRARRVEAEPALIESRADAYLAAVAEHLCARHALPSPAWVRAPSRFLEHFWWPSNTPGLRALAVAQSPAAFRRRGIFIGATTLSRV